jgi:hypothetical protein
MSRVININNPTKIRNQNRRTVAELLRRLMSKPTVDAEAMDMASHIVVCLQQINATVETTVTAWEKRDYWMKAERFMRDWEWCKEMAYNMDDVIRHEAWDLLPELLVDLFPHFADIEIKTMTRKPITWQAAHKYLLKEPPLENPFR